MDKDISLALESVSSVLKDRGFSKEAAVVEAAEAADTRYFHPRPQSGTPPVPTPMGTPDYTPRNIGENLELDTSGKGMHKSLTPLAEIKKNLSVMTPEMIDYEIKSNTNPDVRKLLSDFLSTRNQLAMRKMASLSKQLTEKGFDELGRRLLEAGWAMGRGFEDEQPTGKPLTKEEQAAADRLIGTMTPESGPIQEAKVIGMATSPEQKKYIENHFSARKERVRNMLASIGGKLTDKGYEALGRRLFEAAGRLYIA